MGARTRRAGRKGNTLGRNFSVHPHSQQRGRARAADDGDPARCLPRRACHLQHVHAVRRAGAPLRTLEQTGARRPTSHRRTDRRDLENGAAGGGPWLRYRDSVRPRHDAGAELSRSIRRISWRHRSGDTRRNSSAWHRSARPRQLRRGHRVRRHWSGSGGSCCAVDARLVWSAQRDSQIPRLAAQPLRIARDHFPGEVPRRSHERCRRHL